MPTIYRTRAEALAARALVEASSSTRYNVVLRHGVGYYLRAEGYGATL